METKGLKKYDLKASGRSSIFRGAKYQRGFVINPAQIIELLHDTHPELPIPKDAEHRGIGVQGDGGDSRIEFYYKSLLAPNQVCLSLRPDLFFKMLAELSEGMMPTDAELDGIEISPKWTYIMLRVSSSHWPATPSDSTLPMAHLRYEGGILQLVDMTSVFTQNDKRIRIQ